MIDGNISMEEDTELRDLVVQTLENTGVLPKVRAELRASVFLALEEQESVVNPEPLLNKTVKQYLAKSEGKLLFSLVREFLEYFNLDYTISVYDPETYMGKEYNYMDRNELCQKLGINSKEPLLGELLKNRINGAFNQLDETVNSSNLHETINNTKDMNNVTFDISDPKVLSKDVTSISNESENERLESTCDFNQEIPINVTITDKKTSDINNSNNKNDMKISEIDCTTCVNTATTCTTTIATSTSTTTTINKRLRENINLEENDNDEQDQIIIDNDTKENNNLNISITENNQNIATNCPINSSKIDNILNKSENLIKFDDSIIINDKTINKNDNDDDDNLTNKNNQDLNNTINAQNIKKNDNENNFGKTVYFEEIIVDGKIEKITSPRKQDTLLGDLPPIVSKSNSIFADLPPLNGKKTNINDLKQLMDLSLTTGDSGDNYEEDFASSASGSANEQSPVKKSSSNIEKKSQNKLIDDEKSGRSDDISEENDIEEVLSANVSCVSDSVVI